MHSDENSNRKYVFVCGMPRSGTSVLGRNIARLEDCSGFKNTGALEDEGIYLQDVYPLEFELGGPTRFGFDPRAHRTETSELLAPDKVARLHECWNKYWDRSKSIFVEKTPSNLLMTRFLQEAFPNAYFIVVKRHPISVCMAAQKWKVSVTSLDTAFEHWLHCYKLYEEDRKHLKRVYEMTYENYVEKADHYHEEIAAFIGTRVPQVSSEDQFRYVTQWRSTVGTRVPENAMEPVSGVHNTKYLERWAALLKDSPFRVYYRYLARKYEARFAEHGYSLVKGLGLNEEEILGGSSLLSPVGAACSQVAAMNALAWRTVTQTRWHVKRGARALIPKAVRAKLSKPTESQSLAEGQKVASL